MTPASNAGLFAVSSEWLVSIDLTYHEASAADLGCLLVEDVLARQAGVLDPGAARVGERRVRVAFGLVAGSAGAAATDARDLLLARLRTVRPIPLWNPGSLTARRREPDTASRG